MHHLSEAARGVCAVLPGQPTVLFVDQLQLRQTLLHLPLEGLRSQNGGQPCVGLVGMCTCADGRRQLNEAARARPGNVTLCRAETASVQKCYFAQVKRHGWEAGSAAQLFKSNAPRTSSSPL